MNEFEYYRIHRKADNSVPLLAEDTGTPLYLYESAQIKDPELLLFKLGKPVPKKPKMADYLSSPDSIISRKIFDILSPLNIEGIQLLPARITGKNNELFSDYWAIHIYNSVQCVDPNLSDCVIKKFGLANVKKLVLDKKNLSAIPLKKRLIFRLKEDVAYQLFHVSIVEVIQAVKPEGVGFTNIENWNEGSFFDT